MAEVGDLAHKALRAADRQGNLTGHLTGSARDMEEALRFAQTSGAGPMVEHMALSQANEALARIQQGKPHVRIVLDPAGDQ